MLINDIKANYNALKVNGYKKGRGSLNNLTHDELVEAAQLTAKQTNRQVKNMLLKYDIQSPAVNQYLAQNGADLASTTDPNDLYKQGSIKVSKNMTDEELKDRIDTAMRFNEAQTRTKAGAERWEKKIEQSLFENTGLKLEGESREDKRNFWYLLNEVKAKKGVFASKWASNSDEVLAEVNDLIVGGNMSLQDAIKHLEREYENLGVDDNDRNKIQNKISTSQSLGDSDNFI